MHNMEKYAFILDIYAKRVYINQSFGKRKTARPRRKAFDAAFMPLERAWTVPFYPLKSIRYKGILFLQLHWKVL